MAVLASHAATQEIYVWQQQAGPEVAAALREFAPSVDGFCVLAAEVSWRDGRMSVARPKLDYTTLAALRRPIGLAVRIGPYGGPFAPDDKVSRSLGKLIRDVVSDARRAGLEPHELQVDFDCAESKLAGYQTWLTAWRRTLDRTPLVFTALPAWLKHDEFMTLARMADGFVLQVHSLEKPAGPDASFRLCEPERAIAWVQQAERAEVPFRVALPTYGYTLAFDAQGRFVALGAEGPKLEAPPGGRLRVARADAPAMAQLMKRIVEAPPAHCAGVIWFRLPVAGDQLNWRAETLQVVLRGAIPQRKIVCEVLRPEPGLAEIMLVNAGQTTEPLPARVDLQADGGRLLAVDNLNGFQLEWSVGRVQGIMRAAGASEEASLAPGGRMLIAWLRHDHEVPVVVSLPPSRP